MRAVWRGTIRRESFSSLRDAKHQTAAAAPHQQYILFITLMDPRAASGENDCETAVTFVVWVLQ